MREKSYQEVLRTNGQISFPEVLRQQRRWKRMARLIQKTGFISRKSAGGYMK